MFYFTCDRSFTGRLLTVETINVPAMHDGHVIPSLCRWTEMVDADRSYAFVLRVFYDSKDTSAGRLYGASRLTIGHTLITLINCHFTLHADRVFASHGVHYSLRDTARALCMLNYCL